jgi:hypothetical protein
MRTFGSTTHSSAFPAARVALIVLRGDHISVERRARLIDAVRQPKLLLDR